MPAKLEIRLQLWREGDEWIAEMETPLGLRKEGTDPVAALGCCWQHMVSWVVAIREAAHLIERGTPQARREAQALLMHEIAELMRKEHK